MAWLANRTGLQFGRYGTVMSVRPFQLPDQDEGEDGAWSIELRIEASRTTARRHFFTVYSPNRSDLLSMRQDLGSLVVGTEDKREENSPTDKSITLDNIFRAATPVFLSITASERGTSLFVDGTLRKSSEVLRFSRQALSGQIILGDSPQVSNCWPGRIDALAVYASELSPAEVSRHFEAWRNNGAPPLSGDERPAAMFLFNEGEGSLIHNQVPSSVHLTIPKHYFVAGKPFLEGPLEEYDPLWGYTESIVVNVLGFIPFGYAWAGYFSSVYPQRKALAVVMTVILGGALSLTMEVLQGFLPTRSSGVADIITNTVGTALGVAAYRLGKEAVQRLLSRFSTALRV